MNKPPPKLLLKQLTNIYNLISHPYSFFFILLLIIGWLVVGIFLDFNQTWYKIFHIFEIVVALLMVFIIEATQQADDRAIQEKLDEIIKKLPQTDKNIAGIEKKYKGEK